MTYEEFENIFKILVKEKKNSDIFISKLPSSISAAFFDNELTNGLHDTIDALLKLLFSERLLFDVNYFLYDYEFGWHFSNNYKEYHFKTFEDILDFFKEIYFTDAPDDTPQDSGC